MRAQIIMFTEPRIGYLKQHRQLQIETIRHQRPCKGTQR